MKFNKGKILALSVALMLTSAVPAQNVYAAKPGTIKSESGLFVREKSNKKSTAIGSVKNNEKVVIIGQTKNWYKIKYESLMGPKYGYVLKKYVASDADKYKTTTKKAAKKKPAAKKPAAKKTEKTASAKKTTAAKKKDTKKTAAKKTTAKKTDTKKTDSKKTASAKKTDKKTDKKTTAKKTTAKKTTTIKSKDYQSIIVGTDILNVRQKNSLKSPVISTVQEYETYPIVSETKNWVKIALTASNSGYVLKKYVDFSVNDAPKKDQYINSNGTENTDVKNDNKKPEKDKNSAKPAEPEKPVTPVKPDPVPEKVQTAADMDFDPLSNKLVVSTVSAVNIRKDTNTQSPILAILVKGGMLEAVGYSDEWIKVNIDDNVGYVNSQYVDIQDGILQVVLPPGKRVHNDADIKQPTGQDGAAVVEFAKQFLGNPYVWGGTSLTKGADCSGFIQSVYRYFGYNIRRTSYQQRSEGIAVPSLSQAIAGDIICYDGHVGIYLGDGKGIIHASNPRSGIIITSNASYRPILAIRRIIY